MLDDLKLIHDRDAQDALGNAERQWHQLTQPYPVPPLPSTAENVVYAGMGSSAVAGELTMSWPGHRVPFTVVRGYDIPSYVSAKTYFIAASYSGDTPEVLSALAQAEARGAKITVITSGGQLAASARAAGYPLLLLPTVPQARFALLATFTALLSLLQSAGLLAIADIEPALAQAGDFVHGHVSHWLPTVSTARNPAKQLALEVIGKSAVIYAGPQLAPVAYKWKIGFNENAKHVAWCGRLPEYTHNECIGWSQQPIDKPYTLIELRSHLDQPAVQKSFMVSQRLLSGRRPSPQLVTVLGDNWLEQLLWSLVYGDFVTIYTALLNGLNPAPVELTNRLTRSLEDHHD